MKQKLNSQLVVAMRGDHLQTSEQTQRPLSPSEREADEHLLLNRPFFYYFSKNWRVFSLGLVTLFFTNLFDALPPYIIGLAIDQISQKAGWQTLARTVAFLVATALFLALFRYLWRVFWGKFHHGVAEDLRNRAFDKFLDLGPSFYQRRSVGDLMSLITNDVNSFRMAIGPGTLVIADALFILLIVPPLMMSLSVSWTWKTLILMPIVPPVVARILKLIYENFSQQQEKFAAMSGAAQEIVSGIRVIKSYAQEINQTRLFNLFNRNYQLACNQVAKIDACFPPVMELSVAIGSVILLAIGAPEVMKGTVSIGAFFSFYQYIQLMIWPMSALGIGFNHVQQGKASFARIADLLKIASDVPDSGQHQLDKFSNLEIRDLCFTYPGTNHPALRNISFKIEAGETIGIVGETGAGKSTLVDLLCRLYPVSPNSILYNGISIEQLRKISLRRTVSIVPQDPFLFSKPIQDNMALARQEWSMDEIHTLSQLVNIAEEINEIPEKYDAYLGERGVNLSGGQKQRLTIARALMTGSPLLIFDDSLSAVDAKTEKNILENLRQRVTNDNLSITLLIVSHRVSSLQWADRIVVLNDGEMEAIGTHQELLLRSPTYLRFVALQSENGGSNEC
ncbi:MAG: ABC transporter ATP-binding protein [Bdellovibrionales bacterium]|nr:ABC transporter ATP-binding protein [Bdellovibrionales bacterium]